MGMKKISVAQYRKDCIGCGFCASVAPHTWDMNQQDGLADLKNGEANDTTVVAQVDEDLYDDNVMAEQGCPVQIIRVSKK